MHGPTCPVKMSGTLQRPCANCRYMLARTIFGVWIFTVKARKTAGSYQDPGRRRAAHRAIPLALMNYADSSSL